MGPADWRSPRVRGRLAACLTPDPETAASRRPNHARGTLVTERELWPDGPPHELFKRLRAECPVHWTAGITEYPEEAGYWSVTTADDVHEVSHDWADLLLRAGRA